MFNQEQLQILKSEIDLNRIKTREKGNIQLSYLEGYDVIDTANKVFGFGNWSYTVSSLEMVSQEINNKQNNVICYKAIVKVEVYNQDHTLNTIREDVGFGTGIARNLADSHEGGAKEAITDGIKRSLKSYGNQLGLSLYNKDKNHNHNSNNGNYQSNQPNNNYQQQNYSQNSNNNSHQQTYQYQQDFSQLTNLGLKVIQQGDNLIVVGDNVFANKDTIKAHGFRWDGNSKTWYMQLRQAA